jgi:hypothetical protein
MNHRGQEALRDGDWKYLKVDQHSEFGRARAGEPGEEGARNGWPRRDGELGYSVRKVLEGHTGR